MNPSEENIRKQLEHIGVRVYRKVIVSPFNVRDSDAKMARINWLIEKCGYTLSDERAFPPPSPTEEQVTA